MADLSILAGATSQSILVDLYILTTGAPQTGLVYNSTGLTAYYSFAGTNATSTAITLATLAAVGSAWSSGGFKELDATNMPGIYRFDIPNAAIAASKGREVIVTFNGYSGMVARHIKLELTGWDNQDAVHGGMSALPNTAVTANASLITSGTGTDQLSVTSGRVDIGKALGTAVTLDSNNVLNVSAKYLAGTALTARDIGASVLLSAGSGAGQLDFTSGVVKANATQILGTAVSTPATAGILDVNVKNINNVTAATPGAAGGVFIAGTNAATSVTTALTANITGNLSGSVGSVTGAVGSVTGAVGSVTARVTANSDQWAGGTIPAPNVTGVPLVDLKYILGTALTETAGQIAAAFKKFFNIASPTSTMNEITLVDTVTTYTGNTPQTGDAYLRLGAPAGASVSADIAAIKSDSGAVKTQTDKLAFTVANQVDANVLDWKSTTAPAMTGDAYAALVTTANAEPTSVPAATATLASKIAWVFTLMRNKILQTATTQTVRNDGDVGTIATSTVSDDGTTGTRGKYS